MNTRFSATEKAADKSNQIHQQIIDTFFREKEKMCRSARAGIKKKVFLTNKKGTAYSIQKHSVQ